MTSEKDDLKLKYYNGFTWIITDLPEENEGYNADY